MPAKQYSRTIKILIENKIMLEGLLGVIYLLVAIWAILTVLKSRASAGKKALWILLVLLLPLIGLLIWYLAGPK
ncbi:MAG: uncharacterized membrane protein YhaH (DUF805 family) [Arenicella sp.]|jgi:uncharacterized membrane protein YhaH (DUF805 family)